MASACFPTVGKLQKAPAEQENLWEIIKRPILYFPTVGKLF